MFLSLIQHFRWIAVWLAMKHVTSTIALHPIVAVLVCLLFFFSLIVIDTVILTPIPSSHAREWRT